MSQGFLRIYKVAQRLTKDLKDAQGWTKVDKDARGSTKVDEVGLRIYKFFVNPSTT